MTRGALLVAASGRLVVLMTDQHASTAPVQTPASGDDPEKVLAGRLNLA